MKSPACVFITALFYIQEVLTTTSALQTHIINILFLVTFLKFI